MIEWAIKEEAEAFISADRRMERDSDLAREDLGRNRQRGKNCSKPKADKEAEK